MNSSRKPSKAEVSYTISRGSIRRVRKPMPAWNSSATNKLSPFALSILAYLAMGKTVGETELAVKKPRWLIIHIRHAVAVYLGINKLELVSLGVTDYDEAKRVVQCFFNSRPSGVTSTQGGAA